MKKKAQHTKKVWYTLHMTVIKQYDKSVQLALPEDIEMGLDLSDMDVASLPLSQIHKVRVGGRYNLDTRIFKPIAEVEAEPTALAIGMHITAIKLPKWLGDKNEMTPLDQIYDTHQEAQETHTEEIDAEEDTEVEINDEASASPTEEDNDSPDTTTDEDEVEEIEW